MNPFSSPAQSTPEAIETRMRLVGFLATHPDLESFVDSHPDFEKFANSHPALSEGMKTPTADPGAVA